MPGDIPEIDADHTQVCRCETMDSSYQQIYAQGYRGVNINRYPPDADGYRKGIKEA